MRKLIPFALILSLTVPAVAQDSGGTSEYQVDHASWLVWHALESSYESPPTETLYGPKFSEVLGAEPRSAFVAVGSEVSVFSAVTVDAV